MTKEIEILPALNDLVESEISRATNVIEAISNVTAELSITGIGKNQKNNFDNYKFRGIDDLYNHMSPVLAKHGLVILPNVEKSTRTTVNTKKGGSQFMVEIDVRYKIYHKLDIDFYIPCLVSGEGIDRGDKAINKAMTSAYKNLCFQMFCIPIVGKKQDSEFESPEIIHPQQETPLPPPKKIKDHPKFDEVNLLVQHYGIGGDGKWINLPINDFNTFKERLDKKIEEIQNQNIADSEYIDPIPDGM